MEYYLSIANLAVSALIIPVLGYVIKMENRITKLEAVEEYKMKLKNKAPDVG